MTVLLVQNPLTLKTIETDNTLLYTSVPPACSLANFTSLAPIAVSPSTTPLLSKIHTCQVGRAVIYWGLQSKYTKWRQIMCTTTCFSAVCSSTRSISSCHVTSRHTWFRVTPILRTLNLEEFASLLSVWTHIWDDFICFDIFLTPYLRGWQCKHFFMKETRPGVKILLGSMKP